jgi:hypothetical protein
VVAAVRARRKRRTYEFIGGLNHNWQRKSKGEKDSTETSKENEERMENSEMGAKIFR